MAVRKKTLYYGLGSTTEVTHFPYVFVASSGGTVFTNKTTDAASSTTFDVQLFGTVDDALYLGHDAIFGGYYMDVGNNPAGGAKVIEYWNGSAWVTLTHTNIVGNDIFSVATSTKFDPPSDWATTTVSGQSAYWVRSRTTTAQTNGGYLNYISAGSLHLLGGAAKTIHIAETTSRTIIQAWVTVHTDISTAGQGDHYRLEGRIGGSGAWTTLVDDSAVALHTTSTENTTWLLPQDMTALFTAGFGAGASNTLELRVCRLQRMARNLTDNNRHWNAEIGITYDASDTAATQTRTLRLRFDSLTTPISNILQTVGSIPYLTGGASPLIAEASPTIRDLYVVYENNASEAGSADIGFYVRADAEAEFLLGTWKPSAASWYFKAVRVRTDLDPTVAHTFDVRSTNAPVNDFSGLGGYVVVTYTFDDSTSTRYTLYRQMGAALCLDTAGGTTAADATFVPIGFQIPEANPSLKQSGIGVYAHYLGDPGNHLIKIGSQTARSYPASHTTPITGVAVVSQRFDSGGAAGAAFTLAHGHNVIVVSSYADTTPANIVGEYVEVDLVYQCDRHATKRSTWAQRLFFGASMATAVRQTGSKSVSIPEADYWLDHCSIKHGDFTLSQRNGNTIQVSKGANQGYFAIMATADLDLWQNQKVFLNDITTAWKRYPTDVFADRMDIETSRTWKIAGKQRPWLFVNFCWHDYTWTLTGAVSGYTGTGVGLQVTILQQIPVGFGAYRYEIAGVATTTTGGAYSFTWYDDTLYLYGDCDEVGGGAGRSELALAT